MPPSAWPGTVQRKTYLPGLRFAVKRDVPPLPTTSPSPSPSRAMLWSIGDGLSITNSIFPGGAVAVLAVNASAPALVGVDLKHSVLGRRLAALLHADVRERARVLPGFAGGLAHVGSDVARVVTLDEVRGHDAVAARVRDLPAHDALDRLVVHPVASRLRECLVEVGALRALGAGPRERVAAAAGALADEERLAVHEVGRFLAAARGQRQHGGERCKHDGLLGRAAQARGIQSKRLGRRRDRVRQVRELPARRRDHSFRHALPPVTRARQIRERLGRRRPPGGRPA